MHFFVVHEAHCLIDYRAFHVNAALREAYVTRPHLRQIKVYELCPELCAWLDEHAGIREHDWFYRATKRKLRINDAHAAFAYKLRWG